MDGSTVSATTSSTIGSVTSTHVNNQNQTQQSYCCIDLIWCVWNAVKDFFIWIYSTICGSPSANISSGTLQPTPSATGPQQIVSSATSSLSSKAKNRTIYYTKEFAKLEDLHNRSEWVQQLVQMFEKLDGYFTFERRTREVSDKPYTSELVGYDLYIEIDYQYPEALVKLITNLDLSLLNEKTVKLVTLAGNKKRIEIELSCDQTPSATAGKAPPTQKMNFKKEPRKWKTFWRQIFLNWGYQIKMSGKDSYL